MPARTRQLSADRLSWTSGGATSSVLLHYSMRFGNGEQMIRMGVAGTDRTGLRACPRHGGAHRLEVAGITDSGGGVVHGGQVVDDEGGGVHADREGQRVSDRVDFSFRGPDGVEVVVAQSFGVAAYFERVPWGVRSGYLGSYQS
ncbi:hypothetical protein IU470_08860 [Nocardia abscessus]|uniref:Uncharacterized protein n=1 Tax=Nocardia abscessus TaxID=120957 RepID=A0ABS0C4A3_9NOCA|nr:hypothetical protein [Nocardia abscessus]MBF6225218.1 hypothetical protein [Nocardia abscessus]